MLGNVHVKGDYYTTIHLTVPPRVVGSDIIRRCCQVLSHLSIESGSISKSEFIDPCQFHISLSKGVNLRYHFIDPFISELTGVISNFPITLDTNSINVYANERRSKYFIGIGVDNLSAKSKIQQLLDELDFAVGKFGFSMYRGTPHVSLLSTERDLSKTLELMYPGHSTLLWPNVEERIKLEETSVGQENFDGVIDDLFKGISELELEDSDEFESNIVYDDKVASFNAKSVLVTVGAKITRINFR